MFIRAKQKDIDVVIDYKKRMAKEMESFESPVFLKEIDNKKLKEKLLEHLKDEDFYFILYVENGKNVGYISFNVVQLPILTKNKFLLHISNVYVKPEFRRVGVAKKLIDYAISVAKEKDCIQVELNVFKNNPAKYLYEEMGFNTFEFNMKINLEG